MSRCWGELLGEDAAVLESEVQGGRFFSRLRDAFNLSLYGYSEAFGSLNAKYGLGSAIAVVLTLIVLLVTAVHSRMIIRQEGVA